MERKFIAFVFQFLSEMGVDAGAVVSAYAESQGFKGLRQERDLRALLTQQYGVDVKPIPGFQAPLTDAQKKVQDEADAAAAAKVAAREAAAKESE